MASNPSFANAKALLTVAASFAATLVLARSVANDLLPPHLRSYLYNGCRDIFNQFSSQLTMIIDERDDLGPNQMYDAAVTYLATKVSPSTHRLKVTKTEKEDNITTTMESNQQITY